MTESRVLFLDGPLAGQPWFGPATPQLTIVTSPPDDWQLHTAMVDLVLQAHTYRIEGTDGHYVETKEIRPYKVEK